MPHLKFIEKFRDRFSPIADLWEFAEHGVPATPGVYMLVAKPSIRFRYPAGWSSVYYIGHTHSLHRRLSGHLSWHDKARKNTRGIYTLVEPRHEYGGAFGQRYCFIKTWRGLKSRSLEDIVLAEFAKFYRAFPVANGAGAWKRIEQFV